MQIKIDSLNHEEYSKLIDYIKKAENISVGRIEIKEIPIYQINVERVIGNPPVYRKIILEFQDITLEQFPQDKKTIRNSLKGLIDLLPIK